MTPNMQAFAGDKVRQMHLRACARDPIRSWQATPEGTEAEQIVKQASKHSGAEAAQRLRPLFSDTRWANGLIGALCDAARADPFYVPPMRDIQVAGSSGLYLLNTGPISIALTVIDAQKFSDINRNNPASRITGFSPGYSLLRFIKTGGASITHYSLQPAGACAAEGHETLCPNKIYEFSSAEQSFLFQDMQSDVVMLRAFIQHGSGPVREFDTHTGKQVLLAQSDRAATRCAMMLSLLRAMERKDAAAIFIDMLRTQAGDLRWQVMREFLALDLAGALPHLILMTEQERETPVGEVAAATLAMLRQQYPQLFALEQHLCPA